jgi:membrane-associated phospholipid phosphatase
MNQDASVSSLPAGPVGLVRTAVTSRFLRESVLLVSAYLLYYLARHWAVEAQSAFENARYLMKLENSLGLFKEMSFQSALLSYDLVVHTFNIIYFYAHWPAIIALGIYLFWRQPRVYTITRNAFLLSGAVALIFFALFPTAPPRLAMFGIVDTLSMTVPVDYDNSPLVNPYAALPSLHVGWCLLISASLFLCSKRRVIRAFALVLTPAMLLATVVTGNHFFIDGIFGIILAGTAFIVAVWLHKHWPTLQLELRQRVRGLRQRRLPAVPAEAGPSS